MLNFGLAALSSLHTVDAEGGEGGRVLEAHGAGRFLQIASSSLRFEWRFAAGVPVVGNIDVKEQGRSSFRRMSNDMRLRVATNAYLAGGGDGFQFIQSCTFCTVRRTRLRTFQAIDIFLRSDSSDAKASLNALTLAATVGGGKQGGGGVVACLEVQCPRDEVGSILRRGIGQRDALHLVLGVHLDLLLGGGR